MKKKYEAVVLGASFGGLEALRLMIPRLPKDFPLPLIIVWHMHPQADPFIISLLEKESAMTVKEADEKEKIEPGVAYFAPPGYHLLVERERTFSLSTDEKVSWARPSIDVLFESAASVYREKLIGIILTGANRDGAIGLKRIREMGGLTIVQDPKEACAGSMPGAAISHGGAMRILPLEGIVSFLLKSKGELRGDNGFE